MLINWVNLSTPLGFLLSGLGGARISSAGRGTYIAEGYRFRFPDASAFTLGSVIVTSRSREYLLARPRLMQHEDRHCTQYAFCVGIAMLPLYALCAGVSILLSGNHASANPFERLAGLDDGGYRQLRR